MIPELSIEAAFYLKPEWIEQALKHSGAISSDTEISSIDASTLSGGYMADTYLIKLTYARNDDGAPGSLVAKFPASNAGSLATGQETGAYLLEINFYKYLAQKLNMRVPECYFAEIDPDGAKFALLLEDLNTAEMLDGKFVDVDKAKVSIQQLALLHAATWNDKALIEYDWMKDYSNAEYFEFVTQLASQGWINLRKTAEGLIEKNSPIVAGLSDDFVSVGEEYIKKLPAIHENIGKRMCLTHCDYRPANLLYKDSGESIALDWQTYHFGPPGFDTYYFVNHTYHDLVTHDYKDILLRTYYDALRGAGVNDYSWDECLSDYEFGVFYRTLMNLLVAQGVGGADGIPELLQVKMFRSTPIDWRFMTDNNLLKNLNA